MSSELFRIIFCVCSGGSSRLVVDLTGFPRSAVSLSVSLPGRPLIMDQLESQKK